MNTVRMAVADGITMAKRNTIKLVRVPDLLGSVVLTPIMFVLLFAYVFGNMIEIPGVPYREFMLPGVFTQTAIFGAALSGYMLVGDLQKGIIDRLRTLPMASSAVLIGRTTSDLLINLLSLVMMVAMGLIVGWRVHTSPLEAALGCLLLLLFAYVLSWAATLVALIIRTPEVFNNVSSMAIFPLVFLANTFIDTTRLAPPLQVVAEWNPVSAFTQAARELFGNTNPAVSMPDAWPLQHAVPASLLWAAVMLAAFIPLATWRYNKAVSR
ncbi:MAG TPA: ABC transporter permease [Streptosporangiaceae bacterium]|nr:ABC transporter permease [Streptosporangiaceae bacterium]